ncbi:MAG: hypothetical protein ACPIOQ_46135, partial [Promethearchaeia archaeon]
REKQILVRFRQSPGCEFEHQTRLSGVQRDRSSSDASSNFCDCTTLRAQRSWLPLYGVWVGTHVAVGGHHELGREKDCEHGARFSVRIFFFFAKLIIPGILYACGKEPGTAA